MAAGCAQVLFEQRMARGFETKQIGRNRGGDAVEAAGKAGAGQEAIDLGENASALDQRMRVAGDLAREGDEDAMDLGLFLFEKADELVVLLDGFERLDVNGQARGAGAVNDARDAALEFGADGDNEPLAADGDQLVLRGAFAGEFAQGGTEALFNEALLALLVVADAPQLRRGVVGDGAVGLDGALDGVGERPETGTECGREAGQLVQEAGKARGWLMQKRLPSADIAGQMGDGLELGGFECRAWDLSLGG